MDMNDDHLFGVSDDESVGDHPLTNYLPIGFFLSRGPLADADHWINILNLNYFSGGIKNTKGGKKGKGGQKSHQETAKEDKSAKRDY